MSILFWPALVFLVVFIGLGLYIVWQSAKSDWRNEGNDEGAWWG